MKDVGENTAATEDEDPGLVAIVGKGARCWRKLADDD